MGTEKRLSELSDISAYSQASSFGSVASVGSYPSGDSGSSGVQDLATKRAILPYNRSAPNKNKWDHVGTLIIASVVIGSIALLLECIAYSADRKWNSIVRGDESFPEIFNRTYFKDKMMRLDIQQPRLEVVFKLILREAYHEPVAILFMSVYIVLVLQSAFMYAQVDGSRQAVSVINAVGSCVIFISSILIIVSDLNVDAAHRLAARELREYSREFLSVRPSSIPPENVDRILNQTMNLAFIQDACALSQSNHGRYLALYSSIFVRFSGEVYTLRDLRILGFCSQESLKFAAFIVGLLFSIMCAAVPILMCYLSRKNAGRVQPGPTADGGIAPAYGYGLPPTSGKQRIGSYDPRFAPVAPRSDLALIRSNRKSQPNKLTEDPNYKNNKGSFDEAASLSMDSFEPKIFASYEDLPKVKRKSRKSRASVSTKGSNGQF